MKWSILAVVFALAGLLIVGSVWAQQPPPRQQPPQQQPATESHEGTVVSVTATKLMMKDKAGKEHAHETLPTTKVTCDGKPCKLTELRAGLKIRVTTKKGDKITALKIEALDKNKDFPPT